MKNTRMVDRNAMKNTAMADKNAMEKYTVIH